MLKDRKERMAAQADERVFRPWAANRLSMQFWEGMLARVLAKGIQAETPGAPHGSLIVIPVTCRTWEPSGLHGAHSDGTGHA